MNNNEFYEVNGCNWFIPVDLIEENKCTKELEVVATESGRITFVPTIYKFRKPPEPEKVVVPKFVAEWIEEGKRSGWHLQKALSRLDDDEKVGDWAYDENDDLIPERVDMIARAWLAYPNITVEQEKLYTVEIPNPNLNAHVVLQKTEKGLVLVTVGNTGWAEWESSKLTESEIKQDFDWAWQLAKEVGNDTEV